MQAQKFLRARELFEALEALPPDQWQARLDELCPDDPELGRVVLELLATEPRRVQSIDSRLRTVLTGTTGRVGPYRLERLIGEGGMGEVWLAHQDAPLSRPVALKLIRAGMGTRQVIARFEAERQALGLMAHPAIAHIYDAGVTERGLPYFAMEYVDGVPITAFSDKHRLSVGERLRLFVLACEGVQHAHQKAILHRDLKPSNILVKRQDGRSMPKIIDFGIAKAVREPPQTQLPRTQSGAFVGTPEYTSPERLEGQEAVADTRADVYALGMILYELLVGALPFEPGSLDTSDQRRMQRVLQDRCRVRPSTLLSRLPEAGRVAGCRGTDPERLGQRLRNDLDWIVLKAISPDVGQRYASVAEFAHDVEASMAGRPVHARPPSLAYLFACFVRRNRAAAVAGGVVLAALVAGIAGTTIALVHARQAQQVALREAAAAEQSLQFVMTLFGEANPYSGAGPNVTLHELLGIGLRSLQERPLPSPEAQARLKTVIGRNYWAASDLVEAERILVESLGEHRELFGDGHAETLRTMRYLADVYWSRGPLHEAERLARQAVAGFEALLGAQHEETLTSMQLLLNILTRRGHPEAALEVGNEMLVRARRKYGEDAAETSEALYAIALLKLRVGEADESQRLQQQALAIRRRLYGPEHMAVLQSEVALANIDMARGKYAEAERAFRRLQRSVDEGWGPDVKAAYRVHQWIGEAMYGQGRRAEARQELEIALGGLRRMLRPGHPDLLAAASRLGAVLAELGDSDAARVLLQEACSGRRVEFGEADPGTRESCSALDALGGAAGAVATVLPST